MRNTRLPLESLSSFHRSIRDQKISDLADAQQHAETVQDRLDDISRLIDESDKQSSKYQTGKFSSIDLLAYYQNYRSQLRTELSTLTRQKQQAQSELDARRGELLQAEQQVKVFEKLTERCLQERQKQQAAQELLASDEWASQQTAIS